MPFLALDEYQIYSGGEEWFGRRWEQQSEQSLYFSPPSPITLIPGARPLGIFETRLVALKVIARFRPILRKKQVEKEGCEQCKGGVSTSFFRNPCNTCILSSPLLSFQFEGLTRLFQYSLLSHPLYRWSGSRKRLTSTHDVFWLPHLSAFTIINNTFFPSITVWYNRICQHVRLTVWSW